ncbi:ABC transporter permease [Streptomyces sp. NBC_00878]|uniref:ABC transporter permease n=1 Tax=Streptomyces sp. NBC_00878 TaxID=2975854 RepID=UPI00225C0B50|nr:ABC transporter permease subunit [Streptomyces sp. NBC_00878]MCX4904261.1 ABC transporter permease subunit [Streptomyces sp. NBC_00878]
MSTPRRTRDAGLVLAGCAVLLGAWQWWSVGRPAVLVPSPYETGLALRRLADEGLLLTEIGRTLGRTALSSALALLIGVVWGLASGWSGPADGLGRPLRAVLLGVPPIIPVVMGMVWWGSGAGVPVFVATLVSVPVVAVGIAEAVRSLDSDLMEMATTFRVGTRQRLRHLVLPALSAPLLASVALVGTTSLRTTVMAELLAAHDGVGARIAEARTNLATDEVFAWAAVTVAVALLVEHLVVGPLRSRARRWQSVPADTPTDAGLSPNVLERTIR